ncbi:insulinase family protein [Hymenobacter gummosus]|uniref:Insulinase family protein n=1 Tax=Hymenobacter gummosus TaxID=1776032 RepID=A0A3S0K0V2_9BACT|nr:pitrilysin family protein [Hymenobacter gummosus]RTQ45012.1 insulinase family protein [Hymenobacter gummosus]
MLNRLIAPPTRPLGRVDLPTAQVSELPNGARLHVMAHSAQPVVRLQILLPAGRWYDSSPGTSLLTARALLEGTTTRTARQIAEEVAFYGASLECEQGFDRATLTLYCLTRHLGQLLPVVQDVLLNATFPELEVEQLKTRTIQNIRVERQKTSYLAAERFSQNLYGAKHPYGQVFDEHSFQQLTADDLRRYYRQAYSLAKAEILLCGDVTDAQVAAVVASLSIPAQTEQTPSGLYSSPADTATTDYVKVPNSLQASLRLGRLWPNASYPDTHGLQVLVKVLGGYFGSRLMKNIREDKGLTYGIYASISHREHASSCIIGSDVNATNAQLAINEIHRELHTLQEALIPEEELETVRNYILGKFLNELGTIFEQADKYRHIIALGLPSTFYQDFLAEVESISPKRLLELGQVYLTPQLFTEVVAGP